MEKHQAQVGDVLKPDGWSWAEPLQADDGFKDSEFPGCQFRIKSAHHILAVNVVVTGGPQAEQMP